MADQDIWEEQETGAPRRQQVVYALSGMEQIVIKKNVTYKTVEDRELQLDVYYPAHLAPHTRLPAVIFVHGDGPAEQLKESKESGQYTSWGKLVAASGMIAVTANHRSTAGLTNVAGVANDLDDLLSYVREQAQDLQIDPDTLGIWTCSSAAYLGLRIALYETPAYIRCIACYYGFTELQAYYTYLYSDLEPDLALTPAIIKEEQGLPVFNEDDFDEFSASMLLQQRPAEVAPLLIARAGLDSAELNDALDNFIAEAVAQNVMLTVLNHPTGQHEFDIFDDDPRSHEIIETTLEFMQTHLL